MSALSVREAMARLARGKLLDEVFEALYNVCKDVVETGQKGAVTLTLNVTQAAPGEPQVVINEQIKRTYPTKLSRGAALYVNEEGFHQKDPRQEEIPEMRVIEGGAVMVAPHDAEIVREA